MAEHEALLTPLHWRFVDTRDGRAGLAVCMTQIGNEPATVDLRYDDGADQRVPAAEFLEWGRPHEPAEVISLAAERQRRMTEVSPCR